MAGNVIALPERGKTYLKGPNRTPDATSTTTLALQGIKKVFADVDYSTAGSAKPLRSGGQVEAILVRNSSGIALLPGRVAIWKAGAVGKEVDGYTAEDALLGTRLAIAAGVVDEYLPAAGVADDDYFWLVVKGPSNVRKSLDANTLTQGQAVVQITAATSQATTAGRIISYVQTSNATVASNQAWQKIGVAMSTSATTDANVLVYVDLPW
jgi:hypothetical protein